MTGRTVPRRISTTTGYPMTPPKIVPSPDNTDTASIGSTKGAAEMFVAMPASPPRHVTFRLPFMLPGMDQPHAGGTFEVRESREPLDVPWAAYRVTNRIIIVDGGRTEALEVTAAELEQALAADLANSNSQ